MYKKLFIYLCFSVKLGTTFIRSPSHSFVGEVSLLRLFDRYLATESLFITDQVNFDKEMDLIQTIKFSSEDRFSELYDLIDPTSLKLDVEKIAIWSLLNNKKEKCPKSIEKWFEKMTKSILSWKLNQKVWSSWIKYSVYWIVFNYLFTDFMYFMHYKAFFKIQPLIKIRNKIEPLTLK